MTVYKALRELAEGAIAAVVVGAALSVGGCTNDTALTGSGVTTGTFFQMARIGRPLVIELFTPWADHNAILRSEPAADGKTLFNDIGDFMTQDAKRSPAISLFVQNMLAGGADIPPATFPTQANVLVADLGSTGSASFLGVESGGRITPSGGVNANPSSVPFGGRGLPDDVAAIELGLAFGSLVPEITNIPDDGKEQDGRNGRPNLANDNVTALTAPGKHYQIGYPFSPLQFPYLGNPI